MRKLNERGRRRGKGQRKKMTVGKARSKKRSERK